MFQSLVGRLGTGKAAKAAETQAPVEKADVYGYVVFLGAEGNFEVQSVRELAYKDPYKLWFFAAVDLIATKAGDFEVVLYSNGEKIENPESHPAHRFLMTPNPYNFSQFLYVAVAQLDIYGQSLWRLIDKGKGEKALINLPPAGLEVKADDETQKITSYTYITGSGKMVVAPASEVVRIYRPDPRTPLKPYGLTEALKDTTDIDAMSRDFVKYALRNGAYLPMIITSDSPLNLSKEEVQALVARLKELHSGPTRAAKPIILPSGAKIMEAKTIDLKAFSEILPSTRDEILGAFRLPASKLGLVEDVNRANAEANDITFMKECVLPRLNLVEDALDTQLFPMLGFSGLTIEFVPPAWEDRAERVNEDRMLAEMGIMTPNEIRAGRGLDPVPWGDMPLPYGRIQAQMGFWTPPVKNMKSLKMSRTGMIMGNRRVFNELVIRHAAKWKAFWESVFRNAQRRAQEWLEKYGLPTPEARGVFLDYIMPDWREAREETERLSYRLLIQGYEAGKELTYRWLRNINVENEIDAQAVLMAVRKDMDVAWATDYARRTGELVWLGIEHDFDELLSTIGTPEDLLGGISDIRLVRIDRTALFTARTEATMSMNMGELDMMRDEGVMSKEWRSVGDAQTRETHINAEAQGEIPLDEDFDVGGWPAQYPGDPRLPDEETMNCRCMLLPARTTTEG